MRSFCPNARVSDSDHARDFAGYEVSTFLAFAATDRLKISYLKFGPTEFRLALIVINALLVQYGTRRWSTG